MQHDVLVTLVTVAGRYSQRHSREERILAHGFGKISVHWLHEAAWSESPGDLPVSTSLCWNYRCLLPPPPFLSGFWGSTSGPQTSTAFSPHTPFRSIKLQLKVTTHYVICQPRKVFPKAKKPKWAKQRFCFSNPFPLLFFVILPSSHLFSLFK